jgi:hypothetical protein
MLDATIHAAIDSHPRLLVFMASPPFFIGARHARARQNEESCMSTGDAQLPARCGASGGTLTPHLRQAYKGRS